LRSPGEKEQLIVSVGRFFGEQSGHSKRQLELVRAFRQLVESGVTGWRLVLIGGCAAADREYAMAVRAEAVGLPVEVRLNAPGSFVDSSLAAASIYWHGAGYGSDLEAMPERAEHFGIAPIEAMSAGAVPVVFDAAGPAEVVRSGVDGLVYRSLDELVAHTQRLINDEGYRNSLVASARERSVVYNHEHFETNVRSLIDRIVAG
jgi:glycosyltransferase involved in cell wall biosynthesis